MKIKFNNHKTGKAINVTVTKNAEGLYRLNDVYKAWKEIGGRGKRLDHWMSSPTAAELLQLPEIRVVKTEGKYSGGTYGCRELLIAYAAHCSPEFHVTVLRSFLAIVDGDIGKAVEEAGKAVELKVAKLQKEWNTASHKRKIDIDEELTRIGSKYSINLKSFKVLPKAEREIDLQEDLLH